MPQVYIVAFSLVTNYTASCSSSTVAILADIAYVLSGFGDRHLWPFDL